MKIYRRPKDWLPFQEFYDTKMAKRPAGACMLFRDEKGKILMLNSSYRDGWVFPGGLLERFESPKLGCERESKEETGLTKEAKRLLVVDHTTLPNGEAYMVFTFDGGVLTQDEIETITLDEENTEYAFMDVDTAVTEATCKYKDRIKYGLKALETKTTYYFEQY